MRWRWWWTRLHRMPVYLLVLNRNPTCFLSAQESEGKLRKPHFKDHWYLIGMGIFFATSTACKYHWSHHRRNWFQYCCGAYITVVVSTIRLRTFLLILTWIMIMVAGPWWCCYCAHHLMSSSAHGLLLNEESPCSAPAVACARISKRKWPGLVVLPGHLYLYTAAHDSNTTKNRCCTHRYTFETDTLDS